MNKKQNEFNIFNDGIIFTISGISGAGKSFFIKNVLENLEKFEKLKAVTTRKIRKDEVEGIDKFFIDLEKFKQLEADGKLDVINEVFGNMYAYYLSDLEKTSEGISLITELYYKEVGSFKKKYPNTISTYLLPRDINNAIKEIDSRNISKEEYNKRLTDITREIEYVNEHKENYDIIIMNDYTLSSVENYLNKLKTYTSSFTNDDIYKLLSNDEVSVGNSKEIVSKFLKQPSQDIVYTSFDGDDMNYLSNICRSVIEDGKIPLNPEAALGYYVSTTTLNGSKIEVMKDCLTLALFANCFYVYKKESRELSEGIIAEMILWEQCKEKGVTIVSDVTNLKEKKNCELSYYGLIKENEKKDFLLKYELEENLLKDHKTGSHTTSYIVANFANYKHLDWARAYCYHNNTCPISPQNILPYHLYEDKMDVYINSRLELIKKTDEVLLFIDRYNLDDELQNLDEYTKIELQFLKEINKPFSIIGWDEALVPKYNQDKKWALTTTEDLNVRKLIKKY